MKQVAVITGGGSGMGLEAARCMPKEKVLVLSGRTVAKLQKASDLLKREGHEVYGFACDVSKIEDVKALAEYADSLGTITNVIHAAGVSPSMADAEKVIRINALGTIHVNKVFAKYMPEHSVIVDVSSNSAYVLPSFASKLLCSDKVIMKALQDEEGFVRRMVRISYLGGSKYNQTGLAYTLSKYFVCRFAQYCAFAYGQKGIRVASLSPGLISTKMGNLEQEHGKKEIERAAEHRMGTPAELGFAIASLADERNGYLAGVDVLADGGSITGKGIKNQKALDLILANE